MKIWIVGPQGTLKEELSHLLMEDGFKVAKLFTNNEMNDKYTIELYDFFDNTVIKKIFENNAYVFLNDVPDKVGTYEGLSFDMFDDSNVISLSIEQFISINTKYVSKDDLVVWLDGSKEWRYANLVGIKGRSDQEKIENSCSSDFYKFIENIRSSFKNVIYFLNESPERIKTIIKIIHSNPKLKNEFVKNFN